MISTLGYLGGLVTELMNWWSGLLSPVSNPDCFVLGIVISFILWLFFSLRFEYKCYGRLWACGGLEIVWSAFFGPISAMMLFVLPLVFMGLILATFIYGGIVILQKLVIFSCKDKSL